MKYDNLIPIEDARAGCCGMDEWQLRAARTLCRDVASRTGTRAWIDRARADLCFGYHHSEDGFIALVGLPASMTRLYHDLAWSHWVGFDPLAGRGPDQIVRVIQLAKVDPDTKAKWRKQHEKHAEDQRQATIQQAVVDAKPEAESVTEFTKRRAQMGRHAHRIFT